MIAESHGRPGKISQGNVTHKAHSRPSLPDFRRLYAFVVVAEELHFGHAAIRLMMAQSPLSRTIKNLEADLGIKLFYRNRRNVRLTPSGAQLLVEVKVILCILENALVTNADTSQRAGERRISTRTESIEVFPKTIYHASST